jgi:glyoxylase-like metal-dependent hydrolase (beta-lactamase superfamily II)
VVVGTVELLPARDAVGLRCDYSEAYPDVPQAAWEPDAALYPQLFEGTTWRLPVTCYVVRSNGTTVLVDTGVGPPGLWDWTAEEEGLLPRSLEGLGLRPSDVDVVLLTHLHIDHLGWNTDLEGVPLFPRARYVVHADALAFAMSRAGRTHIQRCVVPLLERFEQVRGAVELAPEVAAFVTPGHYPGHLSVRISSDGAEATILGDVVPHPALLHETEWRFDFDEDAQRNASVRTALVDELRRRGGLVVCGHFPGSGIGRVAEHDGRVVWDEVSL